MYKVAFPLLQRVVHVAFPLCTLSLQPKCPLGGWEGRSVARGLFFPLSWAAYVHLAPRGFVGLPDIILGLQAGERGTSGWGGILSICALQETPKDVQECPSLLLPAAADTLHSSEAGVRIPG